MPVLNLDPIFRSNIAKQYNILSKLKHVYYRMERDFIGSFIIILCKLRTLVRLAYVPNMNPLEIRLFLSL